MEDIDGEGPVLENTGYKENLENLIRLEEKVSKMGKELEELKEAFLLRPEGGMAQELKEHFIQCVEAQCQETKEDPTTHPSPGTEC